MLNSFQISFLVTNDFKFMHVPN
ncbi:unnamed protein product [Oikopleura dioica]|uniref:Uncharacterized protein n=1 Tax=Oikopleura dioica TaxID=34765 RepID=E4XC48_OIKDI|nr:unnamed protein product [Oikopleura dioica]